LLTFFFCLSTSFSGEFTEISMFFFEREVPGSTPRQNTGFSGDVAVDVTGLEARTCSRFNPI